MGARASHLPAYVTEPVGAGARAGQENGDAIPTLLEAERELLLDALEAAGGNKTRAAELLGVSRPRLYKMMQRHGVES